MNPESVMTLGRQAMETMLLVASPLLLVALVVGLVVGVFQAATQINDMTISFIPKLVGFLLTPLIPGPWILIIMLDYMRQVFNGIPGLVG